jgi:hypothetical protein
MMSINAIKKDVNIVFSELDLYVNGVCSVLHKMKIVIGNDLATCKRDNCTVDKPCPICKSLLKLDSEIDELLE